MMMVMVCVMSLKYLVVLMQMQQIMIQQLLSKQRMNMVHHYVLMIVVKIFQQTWDVCGQMELPQCGGKDGGIALVKVFKSAV